ncbi:MAG: sugar transporter [Gammaproteobacteria bacterium]|nr:MAG: sugar transporter [Gammaproteobacteria bacterium]
MWQRDIHLPGLLGGLLLTLILSGCTGMRMQTGPLDLERRQDVEVEKAYNQAIRLQPINASLIVDMARAARNAQDTPNILPEQGKKPEYRVGPQDILQVTVWDHPELTTPAGQFRDASDTGNLVRQDGTIFYPYIGTVHVSGKTLEEIRALLTRRLARYIENPQIDVRVAAFRSQKVYVTGEVMKPGVIPITDASLTVLDALQASGGGRIGSGALSSSSADLENVTLTRKGQTYRIDVQAMIDRGDLSQNVLLQDGDVLNIPDNFGKKVFVMGEVRQPDALRMLKGRMTLAEALGEVGGVDMATSNPKHIYVIRSGQWWQAKQPDLQKPRIFQLEASSPDALILADQFALQPHDVVFVSAAGIVRWGRVLNQLQGTIQSIALIRSLAR